MYFCAKLVKADSFTKTITYKQFSANKNSLNKNMIKKGDRVRFLNATGGGIVTRVDEKNNLVYVEDADGFEIPTMTRDCVVIPQINETTNFPKKDFSSKIQNEESEIVSKIPQNRTIEGPEKPEIEIFETSEGEVLKVILAFVPVDIKKLQTTAYTLHLVNDSNYYLYYNIIKKKETSKNVSFAQGLIEPNILEEIGLINKEELNDWSEFRVQIIAFKQQKSYKPQNVIDATLRIDPVKFYKLHSFTENDFFEEDAMLIDIVSETEKTKLKEISPTEIRSAMLLKEKPEKHKAKQSITLKKPEILEIDLHINELVDTTSGLSNADMLQLQLDKFNNTLAEYKNKKGQRIVFIHGKGEGVLRKEIEKLLKTRYKNYYFQDASFREYGFGATMVTIK